jgi:hypothetical protein
MDARTYRQKEMVENVKRFIAQTDKNVVRCVTWNRTVADILLREINTGSFTQIRAENDSVSVEGEDFRDLTASLFKGANTVRPGHDVVYDPQRPWPLPEKSITLQLPNPDIQWVLARMFLYDGEKIRRHSSMQPLFPGGDAYTTHMAGKIGFDLDGEEPVIRFIAVSTASSNLDQLVGFLRGNRAHSPVLSFHPQTRQNSRR